MDAEKLAQFKEDLTKMGFFEWTAWCVCWNKEGSVSNECLAGSR